MTPEASTEAIWTQLSVALRRFIRRRVSDDHVADDLLQETFVRIHRTLGTLREADRLAAWVHQIARNVIFDHYRRRSDAVTALADHDPPEDCGKDSNESQCSPAGWMSEMVASLPDGYREAVQLAEIEGITQQEVAQRLGLSLSGAKSRVQRGRVLLKSALEKCCTFQLDHAGKPVDCDPRPEQSVCKSCNEL
jgi:RNA polymerase sigma-70 factor (ECF subfamily)